MCRSSSKQKDLGAHGLTSNYAASASLSDRVYVCRGVVRTHLLGGSARSGWARRRSVRSCASFRFLRSELYQDFFRPRKPAGNCFRSSRGVHPVLARQTAAAHSIDGVRSMASTRAVSSKGDVPAPQPLDLVERACEVDYVQFWTSSEAHAHCRKSSEWIQVWQQRNQRTPRFSTVGGSEGERAPAARRRGAHSAHPSWIPGSDQSSAQGRRVREDLTALSEE